MAHDSLYELEMPVRRLERFPRPVAVAVLGLLAVGLIAAAAAFLTEPARAWRAYLFNWLFWLSVAQGAVILAAAVTIARGAWSRPVRRIALSFVAFLPIGFLLLVPLLFAGEHIFTWYGHDLHGKEAYLNMPFLSVRNLVLVGGLTALSLLFAYWALRPDIGMLRDDAPAKLRGLYARLSRGWRGQETEERMAGRRMSVIAPILALLWALAHSVVAWDFVMSQEEHWFSTLIGPYFFMAGLLGGIAATALFSVIYRSRLGLEEVIRAPQFHDLGKLTFAFCIFWAYLFWSQYIVIWYGLLPWEQTFLVHRLSEPFTGLSFFVFTFLFMIPFFGLLGVAPKRTPQILAIFACIVLVGLWVERYILIYPSFYHGAAHLPFGWQEVGMALPFAGLFLASAVYFATRFPILQVWESPADVEAATSTEEPPGTEVMTAE